MWELATGVLLLVCSGLGAVVWWLGQDRALAQATAQHAATDAARAVQRCAVVQAQAATLRGLLDQARTYEWTPATIRAWEDATDAALAGVTPPGRNGHLPRGPPVKETLHG